MKAVAKYPDAGAAFEAIDKLSAAAIYASIAGCNATGYEVTVRDSQAQAAKQALGTANATHAAQTATPEVTKK